MSYILQCSVFIHVKRIAREGFLSRLPIEAIGFLLLPEEIRDIFFYLRALFFLTRFKSLHDTHTYAHTHTHTYIYTHIYIYTLTHIYIYVHIY